MLEFRGISKRFGGTIALDAVDVRVRVGEILGLIGPNGSGKSTLVNIATGFYRPDEGDVVLKGASITGLPPHVLRRFGIARTFQNLRLYDQLSVLDNVLIGLHPAFLTRSGSARGWLGAAVGSPAARRREREAREEARAVMASTGLKVHPETKTRDLSLGLKKRLELARAMASQPKVLLLDEPTAGLSPDEADEVLHLFRRTAKESGLAVLLIEHRLEWVLSCSDRMVVLDAGRKIAEGTPDEIARNAEVIKAYVGE